MAFSRIARVGTIYSRITSLIECCTMKSHDIPIWYIVYKTFPPKYEPRYDRPGSQKPLKNIFYEEDLIRAKFFKESTFSPAINLNSEKETPFKLFYEIYMNYSKEGCSEEYSFNRAMEKYKEIIHIKKITVIKSEQLGDNNVKSKT